MFDLSSVHLPVLVLVLPLIGAVLLPVLRVARTPSWAGILSSLFLAGSAVGAGLSLVQVFRYGAYRYRFGGWSSGIGVEFEFNPLSTLFAFVVLVLAFLIVLYAWREAVAEIAPPLLRGYFTLFLIAVFAMLGMIYTNDLFNLYVFMEMLSIAAVAIVTINGARENLIAAIKYLLIGTVGSITVLFGLAVLYMVSGQLNMSLTGQAMSGLYARYPLNVRMALVLILTGLGIKAAVFPLHSWLPDAHSAAPAPSSALLSALVIKAYLIGAIKILFVVVGPATLRDTWVPEILLWVGLAAMTVGSVLALGQQKVKRILAYSTVVHVGYIVLGIALAPHAGPAGAAAALFHIVTHAVLKTGLFLSVGIVIHQTGKIYALDYAGVGYRLPFTMVVFSIAAFGMIGLPGTSGFMSKWYLILAAAEAGRPVVLPIILLSSFLSALYYVPIVARAFMQRRSAAEHIMQRDQLPLAVRAPLAVVTLLVVFVGLYPTPLMQVTRVAAAALAGGH